jgi:dynein regulatory complex subunit 3
MSMSMAKVEAKSLESKNSLTPNSLKMSNINANEHEHDYVDEDDADSVVIRENVRTHPATGPGATATATATAAVTSSPHSESVGHGHGHDDDGDGDLYDDDDGDLYDNDDHNSTTTTSAATASSSSSSASAAAASGSISSSSNNEPSSLEMKKKLEERAVIDEAMLVEAVLEDRVAGAIVDPVQSAVLAPGELTDSTVDFEMLDSLVLSFRNVFTIENFQGLERLTKLQLDNNVIETIQGLDHLVNLKWLDLSFNNISRIEGLDKLTKLTDLSLSNNKIEMIENIDALTELQVLSLGYNQIRDVACIKDLRQFRHLRVLNLSANPVCESEMYRIMVFAYLNGLKYLDYELIDPSAAQKARDRILDQLVEVEEDEKLQEQQDAVRAVADAKNAEYSAANLPGITSLFKKMMESDSEYSKIHALPHVEKLFKQMLKMFQAPINDLIEATMKRHVLKRAEKEQFEAAVDKVHKINGKKAIKFLDDFDSLRKKAFRLYIDSQATGVPEPSILQDVENNLQKLVDDLMEVEMVLADNMKHLISEFEDSYGEYVKVNITNIQSTFRSLEDVLGNTSSALANHVQKLVNQYQADELTEELRPEAALLLADKETMKMCLGTSQDNQANFIVQTADKYVEAEDSEAKTLIRAYREEEYKRNRGRVSEILKIVKRQRSQIEQLQERMNSHQSASHNRASDARAASGTAGASSSSTNAESGRRRPRFQM